MKKPVFTGAAVAIITPFKSTGEVDYEEFGKIIDHQIAHGTDAIVVCGTTGEASALHDRLFPPRYGTFQVPQAGFPPVPPMQASYHI